MQQIKIDGLNLENNQARNLRDSLRREST